MAHCMMTKKYCPSGLCDKDASLGIKFCYSSNIHIAAHTDCFEYLGPAPTTGLQLGWYFNRTSRVCAPVPAGRCTRCIPFSSRQDCTSLCESLESAEEEEIEEVEELEEEVLNTWEVY